MGPSSMGPRRSSKTSRSFKHLGVTLEYDPRTAEGDYSLVTIKRGAAVIRSYENLYEDASLKRYSSLEETLDLLDALREPF